MTGDTQAMLAKAEVLIEALPYLQRYAGATFVTKAHSYRTYDWKAATGLLDSMLAGYDRSGDRRNAQG